MAVRGLNPEVVRKQALSQILKAHLDARRREAIGVTEHEDRVWAKLRKYSKDLIREFEAKHGRPPPRGYQCSRAHFEELHARIGRDEPYDQRIGKIKLSTIEEYFGQFCDECRHLIPLNNVSETLRLDEPSGDGVTGLPPNLKEEMLQRLKECINGLDKPMRDVIYATYFQESQAATLCPEPPDGGVECRNREALGEEEFKRLQKEARRQLEICLTEKYRRS